MEGSKIVDNLVDRLSEAEVAKEEEMRQMEASKAARGDQGGARVVAGWARGVVRRLIARRPLRRQVNEAGAS